MEIREIPIDYDIQKKNKSPDRVLVLKRKEGKNTLSSKGITDNRLFSGDNKLHAVLDGETMHWRFKFDSGLLPNEMKQSFTSFSKLLTFARNYYDKRNIEITEVID